MKKHMLAVWLLLAAMPSTAFAADAVTSAADTSVSATGDKTKVHKKTKKAVSHKKKVKPADAAKEKSK